MVDVAIFDGQFLAVFEVIDEGLIELGLTQQVAFKLDLHQVPLQVLGEVLAVCFEIAVYLVEF